eukprot:CAMPEP_0175179830 /NCGR_PEP_ID=MMETSP0087-20121206/35730_1 /TAXON_ID=136419 /ORGANISM="Unknown Unknown, Strain D1" /LENGTH=1028 /DNA_ID=CAMNT_0016472103 /DNA_START=159 /DNA_END=3245 /DNA_ORIENTATION=+
MHYKKECVVGVGFALGSYPRGQFPGWRNNSFALHGDDGGLFVNSAMATREDVCRPWKVGDVVGAGLNVQKKEIFFTLNGEVLESATVTNVKLLDYHAIIGACTHGDCVEVNFGAAPFVFEEMSHVVSSASSLTLTTYAPRDLRVERADKVFRMQVLEKDDESVFATSNLPLYSDLPSFGTDISSYYEVTVLSVGRQGAISVGWATQAQMRFNSNKSPGEYFQSYAYRGNNGYFYNQRAFGTRYGQAFRVNDVIGCGYNANNRTIFFTRNGQYLGVAAEGVEPLAFHMVVGLASKGEKVEVNPGTKPFRFTDARTAFKRNGALQWECSSHIKRTTPPAGSVTASPAADRDRSPSVASPASSSGALQLAVTTDTNNSAAGRRQSITKISQQVGLTLSEKMNPTMAAFKKNFFEKLINTDESTEMVQMSEQANVWLEREIFGWEHYDEVMEFVFNYVDEDFNGLLEYLECCVGFCFLVGDPVDINAVETKPELRNLFPKITSYKDDNFDQWENKFRIFLQGYLPYLEAAKQTRPARSAIKARFEELLEEAHDSDQEKVTELSCTFVLTEITKRFAVALILLTLPVWAFIFLLILFAFEGVYRNQRQGCWLLKDFCLFLFCLVLYPIGVAVYYVGLANPILHFISSSSANVGTLEIWGPVMFMALVFYFSLGWNGEGSVIKGLTDGVQDLFGFKLKRWGVDAATLRAKAHYKLAPYKHTLVKVHVSQLHNGNQDNVPMSKFLEDLNDHIETHKQTNYFMNVITRYILPFLFTVGYCMTPFLMRAWKKDPVWGPSGQEYAIQIIFVAITFPCLLKLLQVVRTMISQHVRHLRYYRVLRDITSARTAMSAKLDFFMDLEKGRNIDNWLMIRRQFRDEHERETGHSSVLVGPILLIDLLLMLLLFIRVVADKKMEADKFAVMSLVIVGISFAYIFVLLIVLVQVNEVLGKEQQQVLQTKKYSMARMLYECKPKDRKTQTDRLLIMEAACAQVENTDMRVKILGIAVDKAFLFTVAGAMLTASGSGLARYLMDGLE